MNIRPPALIATNPPHSGLGNRLRFTLSSQAYAESVGRNFYYRWPVCDEFGARLDELWDFSGIEIPDNGPQPYLTERDDLADHRTDEVLSLRSFYVIRDSDDQVSWEAKLRGLNPVPEISRRAEEICQAVGPAFVGVQVRASPKAHAKTLEASPVSWFIDRMRQSLHIDPYTRFYLSCDDSEAQQRIIASVPNVVAIEKHGGYNSRESIIASVVDLLVLARSKHMLGPYWSSFVYLAWVLSDGAQELETSRTLASQGFWGPIDPTLGPGRRGA